jgi:hypothetical protein
MDPERLNMALELLSQLKRPGEVIKLLQEKFGISDATGWYTVKTAFEELAKDGFKKPWRKASVLSALTRTYQRATERADLGSLLEKLKGSDDPRERMKLLAAFDPERATTNAIRCLDMMAKIHGLYAPDKVEVTTTETSDTPEGRKARITELLAKRGMLLEAQKKAIDKANAEGIQLEMPTPEEKPN